VTTNQAPEAPVQDIPGVTRRHRFSDLYHERTNFQFIKHSRRWAILSGTLLALSFLLLFARGLNFGIEFEGGTSWQVRMAPDKSAHIGDVRDVLRPLGFADSKVSLTSGRNGQSVNVQEKVIADPVSTIREDLAAYGRVTPNDIQFTGSEGSGGTFTFVANKAVKPTEDDVNRALRLTELRDQTVKIDGQNVTITATKLPVSPTEQVADALAKYAGVERQEVSISTVGPTWGRDVSDKAIRALIYFFALLALYLSFRFEMKMAVASIIAVIHDIIFTVGVYALFQFPVTPATVTAFLTILGFSLYDTVVVFDKVRENQRTLTATGRTTYGEMVNRSLNQVLMRSLSTSLVALLPVMSLLIVGSGIFGATSLEDFALALAAGLFIGSYSSIFVAAPVLVWWKEKEPQYKALRERRLRTAAAPPAAASAPVPATAAASATASGAAPDDDGVPAEPLTVGSKPTTPLGRPIQPRARQQRGKKRR
jgi:preprotein translocase subunit SecF